MIVRALVFVVLVVGIVIARRMHRDRQHEIRNDAAATPVLPSRLHGGHARTWVVFTTRYCAQCGPVTEHLQRAEPHARVITVDAERERELADAFRIRSAPTVLLADATGAVVQRLVGLEAVVAAVPA